MTAVRSIRTVTRFGQENLQQSRATERMDGAVSLQLGNLAKNGCQIFPAELQGGPSGRRQHFVDIKIRVTFQNKKLEQGDSGGRVPWLG